MITTKDRFERLLHRTDDGALDSLIAERKERVDMLDKFAGLEDFDEHIKMLTDDIAKLDSAIAARQEQS